MPETVNLDGFISDFEEASKAFVKAKNEYRNEHARILLSLVNPEGKPEGWKKPSEKVLDAMLDNNPKLQLLRMTRDNAEWLMISCRMAAEAVIHGDEDG